MTNTTKRYVHGLLTLETPLHIGSFDKSPNDDPAVRVATVASILNGNLQNVPVIPSSTFRGGFRRAAANVLINKLGKVTLDQFQLLTTGTGPNARLADMKSEHVELRVKAKNDLYMGLFGGGPSLFTSGYKVRHAYPNESNVVAAGIVPDIFEANRASVVLYDNSKIDAFLTGLCKPINARKIDEIVSGRMVSLDAIDGGREALTAYVSSVSSAQEERSEMKKEIAELEAKAKTATGEDKKRLNQQITEKKEANTKTTIANLIKFMALPAGISMYFRLDLDPHLSDAQTYFMLECIANTLNNPLGGKSSAGLGIVRPSLNLVTVDGVNTSELRAIYKSNDAVHVDDQVGHMRAAYEQALADYSVQDLQRFLDVKYKDSASADDGGDDGAAKGKGKGKKAAETEVAE